MLVLPLLLRDYISGEFLHRTFWRNGKCESCLQICFKVYKKTRQNKAQDLLESNGLSVELDI